MRLRPAGRFGQRSVTDVAEADEEKGGLGQLKCSKADSEPQGTLISFLHSIPNRHVGAKEKISSTLRWGCDLLHLILVVK